MKNKQLIAITLFLFFLNITNLEAQIKFDFAKKASNEEAKLFWNKGFDYRKLRFSFDLAMLHKLRISEHIGPRLNGTPFSNWSNRSAVFRLAYKHNRWFCPEFIYRYTEYEDGNIYKEPIDNRSNFDTKWIFSAHEFGIGNRFYLLNSLWGMPIRFSTGLAGMVSFMSGNLGYRGTDVTEFIYITATDSVSFRNDYFQTSKFNLYFVADLALDIQIFRIVDLGLGISYYQGFNQIYHTQIKYQYQGIDYKSDRFLYGTGLQPFFRLSFKFPEPRYKISDHFNLRYMTPVKK